MFSRTRSSKPSRPSSSPTAAWTRRRLVATVARFTRVRAALSGVTPIGERSAEVAGHVLLRQHLGRALEDLLGAARLDQIAGPAALGDVDGEERGQIGHPQGL